jgi:triacylglycerol lipase
MKTRSALAALVAAVVTLLVPASTASARPSPSYPVGYDFLQNTFTAGTAASAPGENIWSCRPSAAHPRPVVLVHGTGGNAATNWVTYAALLANHGYCVFALTYGVVPTTAASPVAIGGLGDIRASARQLQAFVAKVLRSTGARRVDLVGHSQGTLMPNYWVRFRGGARYVHDYISLAPLWHGEGAGVLDLLNAGAGQGFDSDALVPVCKACGQMSAGSAFMQKMRTGRIAVKGVHYTNIVTRFDDVVIPYSSGIQTGYSNMRNIVLQSVCANDFSDHLEIASSPNAAQIVLNTLDPAHAHKVSCRTTLPVNGFVS